MILYSLFSAFYYFISLTLENYCQANLSYHVAQNCVARTV